MEDIRKKRHEEYLKHKKEEELKEKLLLYKDKLILDKYQLYSYRFTKFIKNKINVNFLNITQSEKALIPGIFFIRLKDENNNYYGFDLLNLGEICKFYLIDKSIQLEPIIKQNINKIIYEYDKINPESIKGNNFRIKIEYWKSISKDSKDNFDEIFKNNIKNIKNIKKNYLLQNINHEEDIIEDEDIHNEVDENENDFINFLLSAKKCYAITKKNKNCSKNALYNCVTCSIHNDQSNIIINKLRQEFGLD
jgi:hypothetical protein